VRRKRNVFESRPPEWIDGLIADRLKKLQPRIRFLVSQFATKDRIDLKSASKAKMPKAVLPMRALRSFAAK